MPTAETGLGSHGCARNSSAHNERRNIDLTRLAEERCVMIGDPAERL